MKVFMNKFKSIYNDENIFYALQECREKEIDGEIYVEVTPTVPNIKPKWVKRDAMTKLGSVVIDI